MCSIASAAAFAKMEIIPLASSEGTVHLIVLILSTVIGRLIFNESMNSFSCSAIVFCCTGCGLTIYGLYNNMQDMMNQNNSESTLSHNITINIMNSSNLTVHMDGVPRYKVTHHNIYTDTNQMFIIGILVCMLEAVSEFLAFSLIKTIKDKIENELFIPFWLLLTSAVFSIGLMFIFEHHKLALPCRTEDIIYLLVHALSTGIAYILLNVTVLLVPLVTFGLVTTAVIPMEIVCQYVIVTHLQPITTGLTDLIGAILITVGLILPPLGELSQLKCRNIKQLDGNEDSELNELTPLSKE